MKTGLFLLPALLLLSLPAWADRNPDFDDDAKPILRMQPHLLDYVEHTFDVRDTGLARVPGDETRRPIPPFIFQARPHGAGGAYFITLLIQPGPQGRILKVIDSTQPGGRPPGLAGPSGPGPGMPPPQEDPSPERSVTGDASPEPSSPPPPSPNEPVSPPAPSTPPPAPTSATPTGPTADTPSGPISDSPSTNTPSLAPPPDPSP
jgi:hypothetical protein